jgi:carotenoid cleavage dioxygenase
MKDDRNEFDRRTLMASALGAAALGAIGSAAAQPPAGGPPAGGPPARSTDTTLSTLQQQQPRLYRLEADVHDCEVTGKIPSDLNGAFYRVGPDAQYKMAPGNIPFDGEGHVSMFRIKDGRVNYRSRFVRNDRYLAQEKAGRILFPMYRNPAMDDPSVKGLSRSTANTHIINHRNYLLALKRTARRRRELLTLETVAPTYTFENQLPSKTFTAHPKLDSHTGNMVAFGYESEGHGSNVVTMFEFTPQGRKVWDAKIQVPYVGMLHDFAVTENYIVFYVIPMTIDQAQMDRGGIHWSWDGTKPTYFGFVRRGGDGKDVRWIEGPTRSATHVMGAFDNAEQLIVDVEMSMSNPFPFMPMHDGSRWDPVAGSSHITRLTVDLAGAVGIIEQMFPRRVCRVDDLPCAVSPVLAPFGRATAR